MTLIILSVLLVFLGSIYPILYAKGEGIKTILSLTFLMVQRGR